MNLPDEPGFYLWYIHDLSYMNVGLVQVLSDTAEHLSHLRSLPPERQKQFYIYKPHYVTRTMYHQAHDHLPPLDANNKPLVDGYIPFDFRTVGLVKAPPISLIPKRLPGRNDESRRLPSQAGNHAGYENHPTQMVR